MNQDLVASLLKRTSIKEMHRLMSDYGFTIPRVGWYDIVLSQSAGELLESNGWELKDYVDECKLYTGDDGRIKGMCYHFVNTYNTQYA